MCVWSQVPSFLGNPFYTKVCNRHIHSTFRIFLEKQHIHHRKSRSTNFFWSVQNGSETLNIHSVQLQKKSHDIPNPGTDQAVDHLSANGPLTPLALRHSQQQGICDVQLIGSSPSAGTSQDTPNELRVRNHPGKTYRRPHLSWEYLWFPIKIFP